MIYFEYDFTVSPIAPIRDILIAELGELGFESFVETEQGLLAYILKDDSLVIVLDDLYVFQNPDFQISYTSKEIQQQNWNAEWEQNFKPIKVGEECMVRAPFHLQEKVKYDIVIEPKMSFGTGHHETTHMMLQHILDNDFQNKKVLDMGCGTGVLAIMAEKKGAAPIDAIDIDEWCYLNSLENVERNGCKNIDVFQGDSALLHDKKYDVILANINRNILLRDMVTYATVLNEGGELYLSGFYLEDLPIISSKCAEHNLQFEKNIEKNRWVSAKYVFSKR